MRALWSNIPVERKLQLIVWTALVLLGIVLGVLNSSVGWLALIVAAVGLVFSGALAVRAAGKARRSRT